MIAVDTSALMAILLSEGPAADCKGVLIAEEDVLISAGTLAELLVVAGRRGVAVEAARLVDDLGFSVVPVTAVSARQIAEAYAEWGRGVHAAGLNLGDCFAYAVAKAEGCPLLYVGDDFAKTDVMSAL